MQHQSLKSLSAGQKHEAQTHCPQGWTPWMNNQARLGGHSFTRQTQLNEKLLGQLRNKIIANSWKWENVNWRTVPNPNGKMLQKNHSYKRTENDQNQTKQRIAQLKRKYLSNSLVPHPIARAKSPALPKLIKTSQTIKQSPKYQQYKIGYQFIR